jgi:hypothetical protein
MKFYSTQVKPEELSGSENKELHDPLLDSSAVISQLGSLAEMHGVVPSDVGAGSGDSPQNLQDYGPELLEGSDGSYSSRMSTKSDKNMADFDGEDSNCAEEMMQNLTQNQLAELAARNQVCSSKYIFVCYK